MPEVDLSRSRELAGGSPVRFRAEVGLALGIVARPAAGIGRSRGTVRGQSRAAAPVSSPGIGYYCLPLPGGRRTVPDAAVSPGHCCAAATCVGVGTRWRCDRLGHGVRQRTPNRTRRRVDPETSTVPTCRTTRQSRSFRLLSGDDNGPERAAGYSAVDHGCGLGQGGRIMPLAVPHCRSQRDDDTRTD